MHNVSLHFDINHYQRSLYLVQPHHADARKEEPRVKPTGMSHLKGLIQD